jgi:hypothetical protein
VRHSIDWPGGEWLNRKQAVQALGVPLRMFQRLIELGVLSEGMGDNPKVRLWHWRELFSVAQLWPRLMNLLPEEKGPSSPKR